MRPQQDAELRGEHNAIQLLAACAPDHTARTWPLTAGHQIDTEGQRRQKKVSQVAVTEWP